MMLVIKYFLMKLHYWHSKNLTVYLYCRIHRQHCHIGMYRIAIFKIRPKPDRTGYQKNYPAGTGYLNTCCIVIFWLSV